MKPIQIGSCLSQNDETKEIYNKFKDYFKIKKERPYWKVYKYVVSKEPSEELILAINDYYAKIKEEYKERDEFVEKVALDIFKNLTQEEKNKIFESPDIATEHFGFCLWIRNKYIYPAKRKCNNLHDYFMWEPDGLSHNIGSRVASLVLNYDYDNEFYHYLYGNDTFIQLRRWYHFFKGGYPDLIIDSYADLPDDYIASEKSIKKIKSIVLNTDRFRRLCRKYGLTENQYKECKKVIDKYYKENCDVAPYEIALLGSKNLEPEYRKKILNMLKMAFSTTNGYKLPLELPIFVFNQKDAVLLVVEKVGYSLNEELIRIAVEADGLNIQYASKNLRNNFEMAKLAIEHSPNNSVMKYLSQRLRDNMELALLDIKNVGSNGLEYYSRRLRNSDEIAEALISAGCEKYLTYMSDRIQKKYCKTE